MKTEAKPYKFNKWQKKWLEALESGEYKKTKNALCDGNGFCCLGVACEVMGVPAEWHEGTHRWVYDGSPQDAPEKVVRALKLRSNLGHIANGPKIYGALALAFANDKGVSFKRIAAFIRKHPEQVFED